MVVISITIPDGKKQKVIDAFRDNFIQVEGGSGQQLTDKQIVRESIRRFIIDTVHNFERRAAINNAIGSVVTDEDVAQ